MKPFVRWLRRSSRPVRWSCVGGAVAAFVGSVVGLLVGLRAYAPTAWFAVGEVGFPAGIVGAVVGLAAGAMVTAGYRRTKKTQRRSGSP